MLQSGLADREPAKVLGPRLNGYFLRLIQIAS